MATLAFSLAGQVVGGLVGGPFGAVVGRALGALAGSAVDSALFAERPAPQVPPQFRLQGSTEGGAIPRLYGWSRLAGNVIWATQLEELDDTSSGSKGFGDSGGDGKVVAASFAVAFCAGEVHRLGRVWADGQLLETEGLTLRFYRGTEDQGVDSLIEAKQGADAAPAYRGLCYIVFERLPIAQFGGRIPSISVELCRVAGDLEPAITAVTVIPGASEFGYDPAPRVRIVSPGVTANENTHLSARVSDWTLSLDELQALCPNLQHVALVVAWFGDDLRCGSCTIRPRVENASRVIDGATWSVAGLTRGSAEVVSEHDGGPAFGGTPSDAAVRAAIADLAARGLSVTLYPIIMMDIAAGNALPSPWGGTGQPAYPWRGRITCDPAPGQAGTPDATGLVASQVSAFVGSAGDWGYRRMMLHYAQLAVDAGGVDAFMLGSEMRGLSFLRNDANVFPFVSALVALASEVRTIVGAGTRLTYGADWSEFAGLQPADAPGDKFFHLDTLWSCADIDAVGIDNYMPLADWRDGTDHADAALADGPYDLAYLQGNIAAGEGYDWYYASDADRTAGARTPILDSAYGEPWVWRYKDIASWWSNAHHDRIGGVRQTSATAWTPESKPIWFTELGCAATDRGANQPNVFGDPKSSENAVPYFSSGAPDGLMQRQFLRAHLGWWPEDAPDFDDARNPVSGVYAGRMVDAERIYLWTWDARPYPAFPADVSAWSDGVNHATGHWLTGRLGAASSGELAHAIAADYGAELVSAPAAPLIHGLAIDAVVSCRDALTPLTEACGLSVREGESGLSLGAGQARLAGAVPADGLADAGRALTSRRRADPTAAVGQVSLTYSDRERGYLNGTATALNLGGGTFAARSSPLVLDPGGARRAVESMLQDANRIGDTLEFALPPSALAYEAGDVVDLGVAGEGPFEITEIRDAGTRRISARPLRPAIDPVISGDRAEAMGTGPAPRALPVFAVAHLPADTADPSQSRLLIAAAAAPWPADIVIRDDLTDAEAVRVTRPGRAGQLTAALDVGPLAYWDDRNEIALALPSGHLSAADDETVLAGTNRVAVQTDSGAWEVIGFVAASLVAPQTYVLGRLLRGQWGTDHAVGPAAAGNAVIVLDDRVARTPVPTQWLGETMALRAYAGTSDAVGTAIAVDLGVGPALPLAPAHPRAVRDGGTGDIAFSWTRRSRADGNGWGVADAPLEVVPEAYRLTVYDGSSPVRVLETSMPAAAYPAAMQVADFGGSPTAFDFAIAQISPLLGPGHSARGTFHA